MSSHELEEDEDNYFLNTHAEIPGGFRELRACMVCSLIKTFTQFYDNGCENCPFLNLTESRQRVSECTTSYYEGYIAMMQPKESWVAKWQRIVRHVPGIYAISVSGELPESFRTYLEDRNIPYKAQAH